MNSMAFHEPKQHGTRDFPFEYYYVDAGHPRYKMPFHWHKEWEIIHILEGSLSVHVEDTLYEAHADDILLIRDGMLHGGTPQECIYECFVFDLRGLFRNLDIAKKYVRPIYRMEILPDVFYPAERAPEILSIVQRLHRAYLQDPPEESMKNPVELIVIGSISQLFSEILQSGLYAPGETNEHGSTHKIDLIKTVLEYIGLHYADEITLDELASVANLNPRYFCRFFRSITHQTPMGYVNMYRIERAAHLLNHTDMPITSVCMECGFNDSSNFIKVFRKYKGVTPNQYRKLE